MPTRSQQGNWVVSVLGKLHPLRRLAAIRYHRDVLHADEVAEPVRSMYRATAEAEAAVLLQPHEVQQLRDAHQPDHTLEK